MPNGAELAQAWIRLTPTLEGAQGEIAKGLGGVEDAAEDSGKRAGNRFSGAMKAGLMVATAAIAAGVVKVFSTGIEELKFGEKINAQTKVLLENTNFSMSVKAINDYTLALSKVSGVSEEELQQAGNNVLKFGNLSEENYKKAVASINDLAATGKDAAATGEMLGKALADPATAAGKLRKAGIQLTEQQEAQIKAMVDAGDVAGAQGVILDQLEGTYGGMAEAAGGTLEGGLNKLNNAFENLSGDLVSAVMPALMGALEGFQGFIDWLSANQGVIPIFAAVIGVVLVAAFVAWAASIWAANAALLANPITWVVLAVVALIAAIVLLVMNWDTVVAFLRDVWDNVVNWLAGTLSSIAAWWTDTWNNVVNFFVSIWTSLQTFFTNLWTGILNWYMGIIISIYSFLVNKLNEIRSFWTSVWTGIVSFFTGLWNGVVGFVAGVFQGIGDTILGALNWISGAWNNMWSGMVSFLGRTFSGLASIVRGPMNAVISLVNGAIGAINGIKVKIPDGIPGIGGQTIGFSIAKIPMLANGGTITAAGLTIVGENGPELLNLPKGAQVNPDYDGYQSGRPVTFNNYAPLGKSAAQQLTEFSNRAKGL